MANCHTKITQIKFLSHTTENVTEFLLFLQFEFGAWMSMLMIFNERISHMGMWMFRMVWNLKNCDRANDACCYFYVYFGRYPRLYWSFHSHNRRISALKSKQQQRAALRFSTTICFPSLRMTVRHKHSPSVQCVSSVGFQFFRIQWTQTHLKPLRCMCVWMRVSNPLCTAVTRAQFFHNTLNSSAYSVSTVKIVMLWIQTDGIVFTRSSFFPNKPP